MADDGTAAWIAFLIDIGNYPNNRINKLGLAAWAQAEGIPPSCNNPLAANDRLPGDRCCIPGSDSIPCYPSDYAAALLYHTKFNAGQWGYGNIEIALKAAQTFYDLWHAVNQSAWCCTDKTFSFPCKKPCGGGLYPKALHDLITNDGAVSHGVTKIPEPPPYNAPPERKAPKPLSLLKAWDKLDYRITHSLPTRIHSSRTTRRNLVKAAKYKPKHKPGSWPGSGK